MMGRYFARFTESPAEIVETRNGKFKKYWGEGSERAKKWREKRYSSDIVEGVEGLVPFAGNLAPNVEETLNRIKSAISVAGCSSIKDLHQNVVLEKISIGTIAEGRVHGLADYKDANYI